MVLKLTNENTFESGFFWNNYKSIESEFLRFLEYVPYHKSNIHMYSPKLTGYLLQVGGYVDSAFKEMANYFHLTALVKKKDGTYRRARKNELIDSIVDSFAVWETIYRLSSNNGGRLIAKLDFGDKELTPFGSFSSSSFEGLEWWKAYNKVKHEYSLHYKKANIGNVLDGLAGAFLLNVVHYPSIKILWQLGHLTTGTKMTGGFKELFLNENQFDDYLENASTKLESLNIGIRVETPLLLYVRQ